jgi:adenylate cyclase
MNLRLSIFTGAVAAIEYLTTAYIFRRQPPTVPLGMLLTAWPPHFMKALFFLTGGCLAGFVGHQIRKGIAETFRQLAERRQIVDLFGKHVSPAVVDKLLQQGADLGSEVRHVCVMFLDIRGFTRFSEQRPPEEVVHYLNTLFEGLIASINRHGGIVNKFLGDGFMAVFGAPIGDGQECKNAVACALEMVAQIQALVDAGAIPPTRVGIGLHAGPAVTGNVGSTSRKEYTIIGDVVNLASRVESLNKDIGSTVLVTDAVWQAAGGALPGGIPPAVDHGPVAVRGREAPVRLFQLA